MQQTDPRQITQSGILLLKDFNLSDMLLLVCGVICQVYWQPYNKSGLRKQFLHTNMSSVGVQFESLTLYTCSLTIIDYSCRVSIIFRFDVELY